MSSSPDRPLRSEGTAAVAVLEKSLRGFRGDLTIADAATRSGLPLRDAETGLLALTERYQGHLAATSKGELVFRFPEGLRRSIAQSGVARFFARLGHGALGVGRLVVRAWVSVVVVGYALLFGVVLIALALRSDDDRGGIGNAIGLVLRIVFEAMFWTFHPFSPFALQREPGWMHGGRRLGRGRRPGGNQLPFYERVNRFVFGPPAPKPDPHEQQRRLLAEIRHQRGRIGLSDVMRVTGLPRGEADALVSRLLLDFDGDVDVSEEGAVIYTFKNLRLTADLDYGGRPASRALANTGEARPVPFFRERVTPAPVTGNSLGSNLLFGALNSFNLAASGTVLASGLTFDGLVYQATRLAQDPRMADAARDLALAPPSGISIAFGLVPFVFSAALFALPLGRWFASRRKRKQVEAENGRRAIAARVLGTDTGPAKLAASFSETEIGQAFGQGAGRPGSDQEIRAAVVALGGDLDLDAAGVAVYRFPELAAESSALPRVRDAAGSTERSVGKMVFSSDS